MHISFLLHTKVFQTLKTVAKSNLSLFRSELDINPFYHLGGSFLSFFILILPPRIFHDLSISFITCKQEVKYNFNTEYKVYIILY